MAEPFSHETQQILDAADRAIARSKQQIEDVRRTIRDCEMALRNQEVRFMFLRMRKKPAAEK